MPTGPAPSAASSRSSVARPGAAQALPRAWRCAGRLEAFIWYYLRVTGILMIVLVFVHLFIMHYRHAPSATGASFVGGRWAGAAWRTFDWFLLMLALTHGALGAYGVVRERMPRGRAGVAIGGLFAAGTLMFASLGTAAVAAGPRGIGSGPGPLAGQTWIPAALIGALIAAATVAYLAALVLAGVWAVRAVRRVPAGWWGYPGQWAFALNRAAGLGVLAFLLAHIFDVALVPLAPGLYDRTVAGYALPYLLPMEAALVAAVVYHAFNGVRLMLLEAAGRSGTAARTPAFVAVLVVTALLLAPSVAVLIRARP